MDKHTKKILKELKSIISKKFTIIDMKLFGSSARNEKRNYSDIDIFLCISGLTHEIEVELFAYAYELELKYDCLIDLIIFDDQMLKKRYKITPIYQNILKEGINI